MSTPIFVEEQPLCLAEVNDILSKIEKRDEELNYRSNKAKDFLGNIDTVSIKKKDELKKKIRRLETDPS